MNLERWHQIDKLLEEALEWEADQRQAFLEQACAGDAELRKEVDKLLAAHEKAGSFVERPALDLVTQQPTQSLVGRNLGPYEILSLIGRGGMGEVYQARDTRLDRMDALKILPIEVASDPDRLRRFVREAKAASALNHPNIATIYEIGESDGIHWIAMELVEGHTLAERMKDHPLEIDEILDVGIQAAEGLEAAHKKGIIHRDIKPANLILNKQGEVKVLDFGLAKRIHHEKRVEETAVSTESQTTPGLLMGTAKYMSPEQVLGHEVKQHTDIWSLGVVLYEMLSGKLPFRGESVTSLMYSIVHEEPQRLKSLKPEVSPELERIVNRALEKKPESRYSSAGEMLKDLREYQESLRIAEARPFNLRAILRRVRKPKVAITALLILFVIGFLSFWLFNRQAKVRWAREELLPKVDQLVEAGWENYIAAYKLAVEAETHLPQDPRLAELLKKIAANISIKTEPPGANVYMKEYSAPESEWKYLGVSPIEKIRLPIGLFRWKMEKEGYETVFAAAPTFRGFLENRWFPCDIVRTLDKKGSISVGMVRVKGEKGMGDFFIDQYEVTNKQFKAFIDRGGYHKKEYWKQKFTKDGKELTWEEALKKFVDQTGQLGPATWEAGGYPEGQANFPVSGVSWYEAAAYAELVGKSLPTATHWDIARGEFTPLIQGHFNSFITPLSNFKGRGTAPVGSNTGMTAYGAYDMAGNAREWCWNEAPKGRIIRGGAWNDAPYLFGDLSQAPPFDRSNKNGFRCALYLDPGRIPQSAFQMAEIRKAPDFYKMKPVPDSVFEVYKELFSYDKTDLNAHIEWRNESAQDWVQEKITFNAAYDNERVIIYLFLPQKNLRPYQTIVYFSSADALEQKSSKDLDKNGEFNLHLSFIVKNGRAVLFPIYKGSFERGPTVLSALTPHQFLDCLIKAFKDVKRSIDYLETRPDIDCTRLAFVGFSMGGWCGAIIPAIEDRLKASVIYVGALDPVPHPAVSQINYVTRVRIPTLMLNGKYDMFYPYETKAKPMFDLLGTPKDQKVLKLYDTDHYIPRNEEVKETLAWLDRYLGPVR